MTVAIDIRTTPFSRWDIENQPDEPAYGYYARLVANEGHESIRRYSNGIDVDARYINTERMLNVLLRLPLSDERKVRLLHATPIRDDQGYLLGGQRFKPKDLSFSSRRSCAGCLHESPHHRTWWDISAISRCPLHDTLLQDKDEDGKELHWWWPFIDTTPGGISLAKQLPRVPEPGGFAFYIMSRCGFVDPVSCPRLDPLPLGTVLDACEMVGKLVSSKWSDDVPETEPAHYDAGYDVLRHDGAAVVEHLREWLRKSVPHTMHARGYTIVFGWANRRRQVLGDEGLSKFFQKAFRKALALEARGSTEAMTSEQFEGPEIGLTELAKRIGVNRKGLPAVAAACGLLPEREWYRAPVKFDAAEADAIAFQLNHMLTRIEVADKLGLYSQDVQALVDAGWLTALGNVTRNEEKGQRFLEVEVTKVLEMLASLAEARSEVRVVSPLTYGRRHNISLGQVLVQVLTGALRVVERDSTRPGIMSVGILPPVTAPQRVAKRVVKPREGQMSLGEAEAELNVSRPTLCALIEEGHLTAEVAGDCTWLDRIAVLAFASEHRIAREFLPWFGDNLYQFTSYMGDAGYAPILRPRSKAEGSVNAIYRLSDVMTEFHLERDPTRFHDPQLDEAWQQLRQLDGRLPPYLQFPRELPVVGQLVANPKRTVAFQVSYDPTKRIITMEGKRQAAHVPPLHVNMSGSATFVDLEQTLLQLSGEGPR